MYLSTSSQSNWRKVGLICGVMETRSNHQAIVTEVHFGSQIQWAPLELALYPNDDCTIQSIQMENHLISTPFTQGFHPQWLAGGFVTKGPGNVYAPSKAPAALWGREGSQEGVLTAGEGQVVTGAQQKEQEGARLSPGSLPQKWYDFWEFSLTSQFLSIYIMAGWRMNWEEKHFLPPAKGGCDNSITF